MYKAEGLFDKAMETARRAEIEHSNSTDLSALRWLSNECARLGEHEAAIEYALREFTTRPSLNSWENLKLAANEAGQWHQVRKKSIKVIENQIKDPDARVTMRDEFGRIFVEDVSRFLLVSIHLAENDRDAAWKAAEPGLSGPEWEKLADATSDTHARLAIQGYILAIAGWEERRCPSSEYPKVVDVLRRMGDLMQAEG